MKYDRIHAVLHALDPKDWADLDGERFVWRPDVSLHLDLDDVVDGEEVGECCGVLPDKYESFILAYGSVDLAEYVFAIMDRREAASRVVPYGFEEDNDRVSLAHYNVGCLVYGKDVMDEGMKAFKIRVNVEGSESGLQ